MCYIVIHKDKQIETVKDFESEFGGFCKPDSSYKTIDPESCLCQVDVEKELRSRGIDFIPDMMTIKVIT